MDIRVISRHLQTSHILKVSNLVYKRRVLFSVRTLPFTFIQQKKVLDNWKTWCNKDESLMEQIISEFQTKTKSLRLCKRKVISY